MSSRRSTLFWGSCLSVLLGAMLWLAPGVAQAQYKNTIFGLDAGYWLSTKPSTVDPTTGQALTGSARPLRLPGGLRIGGEGDIKMDEDHWWFIARVNLGLFINPGGDPGCTGTTADCLNARFDVAADKAVGDLFGLQGVMGVRYVFLTDNFRPYMQLSLSYMRLFSFTDASEQDCNGDVVFCASGGTNADNFLPHPNVGGVHITPGAEIIIARDTALHLFVDSQWWIIFNAKTNFAFVFGAGINFFT